MTEKIPVILDTDIGFDVDDVWALVLLLNCPELDIKLITTATGDTAYRARIVAKILSIAGREDIPIGVGIPLDSSPKTHSGWLGDYDLKDYQGEVHRDGVGAICDLVERSTQEITIVAIGPLPNIAAALSRSPDMVANARFVGMHGSIRKGYLGAEKPMREYNVKQHALSCQAVLQASWPKLITPLDTCGTIVLDGERFQKLLESESVLARCALDVHFDWFSAVSDWPILSEMDAQRQTSILYDSVAVYLAITQANLRQWVEIEQLQIIVTDDGKTLVDDTSGHPVDCALSWRNKDAFLDFLVERLCV